MQAKQFIDLLENQQLLSQEIIDELRRQVADAKSRLTPELIAKLLVDNGHLTRFQATKLVTDLQTGATPAPNQPKVVAPKPPDTSSELDLLPDDIVQPEDDVAEVFLDDDLEPLDAEVEVEAVPVEVEAVEVEAVPVVVEVEATQVFENPVGMAATPFQSPAAQRPAKVKKINKANPWDSFRILGVGLILALILVLGGWLLYHFIRGDAETLLKRADDAYEARGYENAANFYKDFVSRFPSHEKSSFAKVRNSLAQIRRDVEGAADPTIGLNTALSMLPAIENEPAMSGEQNDVTGILLSMATKFNERAERLKTTAERKQVMGEMDKLLSMIENPKYIGTNQRNQQAPTLKRIEEDRLRILREINRDEDLVKALEQITTKLAEKDTVGAYTVRRELINRYPQLEADPGLISKVSDAAQIQASLVSPAAINIKLSKEAPATSIGRSFVLSNTIGESVPSLSGYQIFVKANGSVYGLDGQTGKVLWRQFVGQEFRNDPIRLSDTAASDVIICQPEAGKIQRLAGATGQTQWFAQFEKPIHRPIVDGEELFVAAVDGSVVNLDVSTGQTKWSVKLPQSVQVTPGLGANKPNLYAPGEHSNLYVISRTDGSCKEVFYMGHESGSIAIPPVLVLGQLFIFENYGDRAQIRVLETNDQGLGLKEVRSSSFNSRMVGNVVVPPVIDGRRVFAISDLGEVAVLDIEPAAEKEKIGRFDAVPASNASPQTAYLVTANNKLWIAENRFVRLDLMISSETLEKIWAQNPGDEFRAQPQIFGEIIVHTRKESGNSGIRVTAVNGEIGDPIWSTDLGVPVVTIAGTDVINSSAMDFLLANQPIIGKAEVNPNKDKKQCNFRNLVQLSDNSSVIFNTSTPNQFAFVTPGQGSRVKVLSANFGEAIPTCLPTAVDKKVALGLDNGQFVLIDPTNGSMAAAPFQPAMEPGAKLLWNRAAYLADSQTLVVANSARKLIRLGVGDALRQLSEADLESKLIGPLVAVNNSVAAVEQTSAADNLLIFDGTTLAKKSTTSLEGRLIAGPYFVEGMIVMQVDNKIVALDGEGKKKWSVDFQKSKLVDAPLVSSGNFIFLATSGVIMSVNSQSGQLVGSVDSGQPISCTSRVLPSGILAGSDEGAVLLLPIPTTSAGQ